MKKIGICGHYGFGYDLSNGQTIKTRHVTDVLIKKYGEGQIVCLDTHGGGCAAPRICLQSFRMFLCCRNILLLSAHHALLFLTPLFSLYQMLFHRSIHYVVIGGWLPQFLDRHKWLRESLRKMAGIYVETRQMKRSLEERGFTNVCLLFNFKNNRIITEEELVYVRRPPYPLCFFSRITREKGIEDAVEAVKTANKKLGENIFFLDIYGAVEPSYQKCFEELRKGLPEYIRYKGTVSERESVSVVKNYYALLFPTYYEGEGFAGTLLDAMYAGVPVIASDWKYNREIVVPNCTGMLTPANAPQKLADCLLRTASDPVWWNRMKKTTLKAAGQYTPERIIHVLTDRLV